MKLVSLYSTIKMMHGPINIRFTFRQFCPMSVASSLVKTQHVIMKTPMIQYISHNSEIISITS